MNKRVAIICADGAGSSIIGQNCAHFVRQNSQDQVTVFYPSDNAKFDIVKYLCIIIILIIIIYIIGGITTIFNIILMPINFILSLF